MKTILSALSLILLFSCCSQEQKIVQEGDIEYRRTYRDGVLVRSVAFDKKTGRRIEESRYRKRVTVTDYWDENGERVKRCKGRETAVENRK